jgi:hypothetical protein
MFGIVTSCSKLVNFGIVNNDVARWYAIYLPQYQVFATVRLTYIRPILTSLAEAAMRRIPLRSTSCSNTDGQSLGLECVTSTVQRGQGDRINHAVIFKPSILLQKEGAS